MKGKRLSETSHYFKCNHCSQEFTLESFRFAVILYGLIFLVSKHYGYIGIVCPNCLKTTVQKGSRKQVINVKNELGEKIYIVDLVKKNGDLRNEILTSDETKEAIKNHTIETVIFHSKLRYSTFGQYPYDKNIQNYNVFARGGLIPCQSSKYTMTMTQNKIDSLTPNDDIFCSYIAESKTLGESLLFFGSEEKHIDFLVSLENVSQIKVFPRYIYSDSIIEACENFCESQYLEINKHDDWIKNPCKNNLLKQIKLLNILDRVPEEIKNPHLRNSVIYQVLWRTKHPFKENRVPEAISDPDFEKSLTKRKKSRDQNDKYAMEIWSKFTEEIVQNVLSKKAFEFVVEISELAKRIDFSNSLIFDLQKKYLKNIYRSTVLPDRIEKSPKAVNKAFNEAKKELGVEIITKDSKIMEIVINICHYLRRKQAIPDVLILGETGTGKELIAEAYQKAIGKECVKINASAIHENQIESELFGHAKGAFTGADKEREGAFLSANNGVIFLDEIGDLSLAAQAKLLRTIEYREIKALGKDKTEKINVTILMATNKDLRQLVDEGKFREDLFYRINGHLIIIPPLRERTDDIPLLLNHFIEMFDTDRKINKRLPKLKFSKECIKYLKSADWPGNVRSLRNLVKSIVDKRLLSENRDEVEASDIPNHIRNTFFSTKAASSKKHNNKPKLTPETIKKALMNNGNVKAAAARELGYSRGHISRICTRWIKDGKLPEVL